MEWVNALQVVQEFILGRFDREATAAYNRELSDVSTLKDPRSKDAAQKYVQLSFRWVVVMFICNQIQVIDFPADIMHINTPMEPFVTSQSILVKLR